jgi:hypothetical protein
MKARPACFCNEFCHSCEQSNITNSTTELLLLKDVNPATELPAQTSYLRVMELHASGSVLNLTQGQAFHFSQPIHSTAQITQIKKPTTYTVLRNCATAFNVSFLLIAMFWPSWHIFKESNIM